MLLPTEFLITPVELPSCHAPSISHLATSGELTLVNGDAGAMIDLCNIGSMDDLGLSWAAGILDPVSWPWIHESLYLQGNYGDDWPTAVAAAGLPNPSSLQSDDQPYLAAGSYPQHNAQGSIHPPQAPSIPPSRPIITPTTNGTSSPTQPATPGPSRDCRGGDQDLSGFRSRSKSQARVAQELVEYATRAKLEIPHARLCYWWSMSVRVIEAFQIGNWQMPNSDSTLVRMVELYQKHFAPLWPLLRAQDYDPALLHPLLFLVLVSIGAMYGTPREASFGAAVHEEIRQVLVSPLLTIEETEHSMVPLAQARLLTQVAALYFGQRRAFSYAQHLGAVLIAQARRMDLFSTYRVYCPTANASKEEQLNAWCAVKARKRLVFGILRGDVYASVLMNSRPLLSPEEIDFDLPAPDEIWISADQPSVDELLARIKAHAPRGPRLSFCDLIRIAFDRSEALLEMEPTRYELLLFGLQEPVWRFSHDPHLFHRLTGSHELPDISRRTADPRHSPGGPLDRRPSSMQADQLGIVHRRMGDLRDQRIQLIEALRKWERSFTAVRTTGLSQSRRTSVISSLLLFKLSFLRLAAPLADLHSVAQALSNQHAVENRRLSQLTAWAQSQDARVAVDFACQIWTLLAHETERPVEDRAKHNLLAYSGLHHTTVVLWVFAGSHEEAVPDIGLPGIAGETPMPLCRMESSRLIKHILYLYKLLAPVGWCSFAAAAERLSRHVFPGQTSTTVGTFQFDSD